MHSEIPTFTAKQGQYLAFIHAYACIFGRAPDNDELAQSTKYLTDRQARPEAAVRQLEWALLTSSEFLLNH